MIKSIRHLIKPLAFGFLFFLMGLKLMAQLPNPALVGYWHNWSDVNAPYIQLDSIDSRYNVIEVAFAVPTSPTNMTMLFTPDVVSPAAFTAKVQALQQQGKKVLISIGGATSSIDLSSTANKNAFVSSMTGIINTYGFDGIDIDIENGNSILITGGSISSPANTAQVNLIDAIKQIMANYRSAHPKKLLLTITPETAYVQGGLSGFGSIWGGYLPIIHALRDSLDLLQVQLYNSGTMYGIDNKVYTQGTADFIIALTEAVIQGFNTSGGSFAGLPASKVAVGLPACSSAAGGGFVDSANVRLALNYLLGKGPKPGTYVLVQSGGYPALRGMMTWSVNWDALSTCATRYQYANNYQSIFGSTQNPIVPNYVATGGLLAWYAFSGNPADSSGYGFHGTVSGAVPTIDRFGRTNKAYLFNGSSSKIIGPGNTLLNLAHNRTVSVWVKSTDSSADAGIVGYLSNGHQGYQILLKSNGKLAGMEDNYTGGTNTPPGNGWDYVNSTNNNYLNDRNWHHVVSVRSNDTTRLYIDGVLQMAGFTTLIPGFNSSSLIIGATNSNQYFKGAIDEIGIWNRALTPAEIASLNVGCPYGISTQPNNQTAGLGESKNFSFVHAGTNINYQWQSNPLGCGWQNLANGYPYSGAQSNSLSVAGISYPNHNQVFRVISNYGECADTSQTVKLILSNIAADSMRMNQLKNDSMAKASSIQALVADTTLKSNIIAGLQSDTLQKRNTITSLINDSLQKHNTLISLINDTTYKRNQINALLLDSLQKSISLAGLQSDTTQKAKVIADLKTDTANKAILIGFLISDSTAKGILIRQLKTELANKHDTVYVASTISNDTLKISIRTGLPSGSQIINSLKVYPNPASNYLIIEIEHPGDYSIVLSGLSGQTLLNQKTTTLDISGLSNGVYILSVFDADHKLISANKVAVMR